MSAMMQTVTPGGRAIRYLEAGARDAADVLVLVHAFPMGVRMWEPQLSAFGGWRLVVPSLAGFDGSDSLEEPSMGGYARGILALLDHLQVQRAAFAGVSMGGYVIFALLRMAPARVRAVVLADTRSGADTDDARAGRRRMLELVAQSGPSAVAVDMLPKLLGKSSHERRPQLVEEVRRTIEAQSSGAIAGAVRALMDRPDSTPLLGQIRMPALAVVGEEDVLTPVSEAEAIRDGIPSATLARIPEAGHLANLENPAAFNAAVAGFLSMVGSRR